MIRFELKPPPNSISNIPLIAMSELEVNELLKKEKQWSLNDQLKAKSSSGEISLGTKILAVIIAVIAFLFVAWTNSQSPNRPALPPPYQVP